MLSFNWDNCKKYVINLDRREDRAKLVFKQFADHGINVLRWKATDWKDVVVPELSRKNKERNAAGILACAMSHISLITYARKYKMPYVCIFEDDCVLGNDFNERIHEAEIGDWSLCYMGGHMDYEHVGGIVAGTYAYIVRDTVYDFIIRNFCYHWGIDEMLGQVVQKQFITFTFNPFIVGTYPNFSDVVDGNVDYKIDPV